MKKIVLWLFIAQCAVVQMYCSDSGAGKTGAELFTEAMGLSPKKHRPLRVNYLGRGVVLEEGGERLPSQSPTKKVHFNDNVEIIPTPQVRAERHPAAFIMQDFRTGDLLGKLDDKFSIALAAISR